MNSDLWPNLERPDFLGELDQLAEESIEKKTTDGYLAAVLIYQQLAEEILKVYLECHEFFIQLSLFPAEMKCKKRTKAQFGRVIDDLKDTVTLSDNKAKIIFLANKLNQTRIDLVHGLTKLSTVEDIESKVLESKIVFDELFELFGEEYDLIRLTFKDFKKDWDEINSE